MRILVTAGPTREYIDTVRFVSNASSGRMGYAVAVAAAQSGHDVTLLTGPVSLAPPADCAVVPFVSVEDLRRELERRFDTCDVLVMAAAVGDFRPDKRLPSKMSRKGGPVTVRLEPTEDILAAVTRRRRPGQIVIAFAVETGPIETMEQAARAKMADKGADFVVANSPAAMGEEKSCACILSPGGVVLPWADRRKDSLAREIVALLGRKARSGEPE
jgi:phosphopantothenoylcysteine decarboxylase/phosphopantothenate--cysteine ligase